MLSSSRLIFHRLSSPFLQSETARCRHWQNNQNTFMETTVYAKRKVFRLTLSRSCTHLWIRQYTMIMHASTRLIRCPETSVPFHRICRRCEPRADTTREHSTPHLTKDYRRADFFFKCRKFIKNIHFTYTVALNSISIEINWEFAIFNWWIEPNE